MKRSLTFESSGSRGGYAVSGNFMVSAVVSKEDQDGQDDEVEPDVRQNRHDEQNDHSPERTSSTRRSKTFRRQ